MAKLSLGLIRWPGSFYYYVLRDPELPRKSSNYPEGEEKKSLKPSKVKLKERNKQNHH